MVNAFPEKLPKKRSGGNRRLDVYLVEEIVPLMLTGLIVVVLLFVLAALYEVIAPILAKGADPRLVARLMLFSLPESFGRGFPIAVLFAVMLGFSRLSSDAEIKAMLAGGVSPSRLALPVLGLSMAVALISFLNNELVVPQASNIAFQTQRDIVLDNPRVLVKEKAIFKDNLNRAIYVDSIGADDTLHGIQIIQMSVNEAPKEVILASEGKLERGTATMLLYQGERVTYNGGKVVTVQSFREARLPVQDLQASLNGNNTVASQAMRMPLRTLLQDIQNSRSRGLPTAAQETALNRKFSEPLAAVAFGFFGVMLALFTLRSGSGVGIVWTVFLTFSYYATWSVFRVMGEQNALPPVFAAWIPDALYVVAGFVLWALSTRR